MNLLIETMPSGDFKVMNTVEELKMLQEKHKELELDLMEADFQYDEVEASRIKKEKLRIKDRIERLKKPWYSLHWSLQELSGYWSGQPTRSTETTMRNLVIDAIHDLIESTGAFHPYPLNQLSNRELLDLYSILLIESETEEYD